MKVDLDKLIEEDQDFQNFMDKLIDEYPSPDDIYPMDIIYSLYSIGVSTHQAIQFFKLMDTFHEDCCGHECEHEHE